MTLLDNIPPNSCLSTFENYCTKSNVLLIIVVFVAK